MKQRKKQNKTNHKQRAKSGKSFQSAILRRVLARVRPTLSDPLSPQDADALRAALTDAEAQNKAVRDALAGEHESNN